MSHTGLQALNVGGFSGLLAGVSGRSKPHNLAQIQRSENILKDLFEYCNTNQKDSYIYITINTETQPTKGREIMTTLSLKIKWTVIQVEGSITKSIEKQLKRVEYFASINGNTIMTHSGNDEKCKERTEKLIEVIKKNNRTGKAFVITDAQFGKSVTSWNGVAKFYPVFKNHIVVKNGNQIMTMPITTKQANAAIVF